MEASRDFLNISYGSSFDGGKLSDLKLLRKRAMLNMPVHQLRRYTEQVKLLAHRFDSHRIHET